MLPTRRTPATAEVETDEQQLYDDKKTRYLDSHVYGLSLVSKNCAVPVHQKVALSGKRKFCWGAPATGHFEHDLLAGRAVRDWVSLAVEALRNAGARGQFLLGNGQPQRGHCSVPTTHDLGVLASHGSVLHGSIVHGSIVHGLILHGLVLHGLVLHGLILHGLVLHELVLPELVLCGG